MIDAIAPAREQQVALGITGGRIACRALEVVPGGVRCPHDAVAGGPHPERQVDVVEVARQRRVEPAELGEQVGPHHRRRRRDPAALALDRGHPVRPGLITRIPEQCVRGEAGEHVSRMLERAVAVQQLGADHRDIVLIEQGRHLADAVGLDQLRVVVQEQQQIAAGAGGTGVDLGREVELGVERDDRRRGIELLDGVDDVRRGRVSTTTTNSNCSNDERSTIERIASSTSTRGTPHTSALVPRVGITMLTRRSDGGRRIRYTPSRAPRSTVATIPIRLQWSCTARTPAS